MKTTITEFQIIDHGIEHAQYFTGCGVALSKYDHVVTGHGDNFYEAIEDCLESMAQTHGINFPELGKRMLESQGIDAWPVAPSVSVDYEESEADFYEVFYYVSVRYNLEGENEGMEKAYWLEKWGIDISIR